nr:hypothetical protein [Tanacetum cinerariifolium]
EMEPEENDGDDEKSEGDSIDYPTSGGNNDANDDGRLRRERRYFRTLATTYAQEIEALQRDVSTLQRQHIDNEDRLTRHIQHEHAQRDDAPEDGDSCS